MRCQSIQHSAEHSSSQRNGKHEQKCPLFRTGNVARGVARAKKGMFEGDLEEGELEIGQVAGLINEIKTAEVIVKEIIAEYNIAKKIMLTY